MHQLHQFLQNYTWFILKNILGWVLILSAVVLGPLVPGPGGIPLFLIGFALVTFPGKRRITARVLRGKRLAPISRGYRIASWAVALLVPAVLTALWFGRSKTVPDLILQQRNPLVVELVGFLAMVALLRVLLWLAPRAVDVALRIMPRLRRLIRPRLRRMGIHLLPPRWHRHHHGGKPRLRALEEEIVFFHEIWNTRMHELWKRLRPLLPKLIGLVVVPLIFYRLLRPIWEHSSDIQPYLAQIRWDLFALACLMFALNQFLCRLFSWRGVLKGLGHQLPLPPSARIWATSELARYVPGVVWQVLGRAYLAKPYGLPMTTCSISQIMEITIYLLANVTVAVAALSLVGGRISPEVRPLLRAALVLLPLLLLLLQPRIFYPLVNWLLRKIGKPVIETRLSGRRLLGLMGLAIAGQLWLGLAIWIVTYPVLQVPLKSAWVLAGAYCLAWTAGFCMAAFAPSGIGVREFVLGGTLFLVLPPTLQLNPTAAKALFVAMALLLRLWATTGELIFAAIAYISDWSAARKRTSKRET